MAVLDSLAHAFKTPLTAICTASSGLIEMGTLDETGLEHGLDFSAALEGHPIELSIEEQETPLQADRELLKMILTQYLDNAAKYSAPETPIAIAVRESKSEASALGAQSRLGDPDAGPGARV